MSNVYKSGTLSSAARECHSLIASEGGVPLLFINRSDVGVALLFLRRATLWAALFSPSFFWCSCFLFSLEQCMSVKNFPKRLRVYISKVTIICNDSLPPRCLYCAEYCGRAFSALVTLGFSSTESWVNTLRHYDWNFLLLSKNYDALLPLKQSKHDSIHQESKFRVDKEVNSVWI